MSQPALEDNVANHFTHDEVVMLRFIGICQPSLDPERYEAVLDACATLCANRKGLTAESIDKCLEHLGCGRK